MTILSFGTVARGVAVCALLTASLAAPALAAEIKVLSTTNMMPILDSLAVTFEQSSGHKLKIEHGGAAPVQQRIAKGEAFDVVIHSRNALDDLAMQGKVQSATIIDMAHIPVGVAVKAGAAKPDVSSVEAFKRALLAASSVAYPDPAGGSLGGIYAAALLAKLGIIDRVKVKLTGPATAAAELVANGGADMVVDQLVQLQAVKGLDLVLPLPIELKPSIAMSAGIPTTVREAQAAAEFVKFLASRAAAPAIRAKGMEP